jgi:hypothetical protein
MRELDFNLVPLIPFFLPWNLTFEANFPNLFPSFGNYPFLMLHNYKSSLNTSRECGTKYSIIGRT